MFSYHPSFDFFSFVTGNEIWLPYFFLTIVSYFTLIMLIDDEISIAVNIITCERSTFMFLLIKPPPLRTALTRGYLSWVHTNKCSRETISSFSTLSSAACEMGSDATARRSLRTKSITKLKKYYILRFVLPRLSPAVIYAESFEFGDKEVLSKIAVVWCHTFRSSRSRSLINRAAFTAR